MMRTFLTPSLVIGIGCLGLCWFVDWRAAGYFILGYAMGCVQFGVYRLAMAVEVRLAGRSPASRLRWRDDPTMVSFRRYDTALVTGSLVLLVMAAATALDDHTLAFSATLSLPTQLLLLTAGLLSFGGALAQSCRKVTP